MTSSNLVIDSWAIMAYVKKEAAYQKVRHILKRNKSSTSTNYLSQINLGEVYYNIARDYDHNTAQQIIILLKKSSISIEPVTEKRIMEAATIKADHSIAYGDCFAAQLAIEKKCPLLTGDPEFKKIENLIQIEWIN